MRTYPRNFIEFKNKHQLNEEEVTIELIKERFTTDIIFRNDLAFLSLFRSLKRALNRHTDLHLNTQISDVFSTENKKELWSSFQSETELYIPSLGYRHTKIGCALLIACLIAVLIVIIFVNSSMDAKFFSPIYIQKRIYF